MDIPFSAFVRAAHILAAALWIGAAAMLTLYILPAVRRTGPGGGAVVAEAMRRGLGAYMPSVAGLTVLSGGWLYWVRFHTAGATGIGSASGIVLTVGAACGIVAMIIGGAVLGRVSHELALLAAAPASETTQARVAALHARGASASKITLTLLVAALLLMVASRWF